MCGIRIVCLAANAQEIAIDEESNIQESAMKLFAAILMTLTLLLGSTATAAPENSLSSYTKQLIALMDVFGKLNEATAKRMRANERYLMAKAMYRLSGGFYQLMVHKNRLAESVYSSVERGGGFDPDLYLHATSLLATLRCLEEQLDDKGARIGAFVGIDGAKVVGELRGSLKSKSRDLKDLVTAVGLDPATPNLTDKIEEDATRAQSAAKFLYEKTASFARLLDSSAIPPEQPKFCERPQSKKAAQ